MYNQKDSQDQPVSLRVYLTKTLDTHKGTNVSSHEGHVKGLSTNT